MNCSKDKESKTESALGLLGIVNSSFNLKCYKNKMLFAGMCAIAVLVDMHHYKDNDASRFSLLQFYISAALLLIIYLWTYYAPKLVKRIDALRSAFDEEQYYEAYIQYRLNMFFTARLHNVKEETRFREFVASIYGDRKMPEGIFSGIKSKYKTHGCIKSIYLILWSVISGFMVISTRTYIYDFDLAIIYNYMLFMISLILNCYSFYGSITFAYFMRGLITKDVDKWEYNKYLPSKTKGFSIFVSNAKMNSFIFFLVSALYTLTYYMLIIIPLYRGEAAPLTDIVMFLQINIIILAGAGMSIALFIADHFFLRRILEKWKERAKAEIDKTWRRVYFSKDRFNDILNYTGCLEKIDSDKIKYDYIDLPSFILSIITIVLNVLYIYSELRGN